MKNIVIIGVTSAIAEAVARQYASKGCNLYVTARNEEKLEQISADLKVRGANNVISKILDVTDLEQQQKIVESASEELNSIDAVLIAPGTLPDQKTCEQDMHSLVDAINVNGTFTLTLMQLFANKLSSQGSGVLAAISSPAGDRGRQSNYVYGAAKGSVSLFAQGLRNAMYSKGVHVLTIKPGFVDTPMTAEFDKSGPLWAQPTKVADDIVKAISKKKNTLYTPWFWWGIMQIIKNIPENIFKRLSL